MTKNVCKPFWAKANSAYLCQADSMSWASLAISLGIFWRKNSNSCCSGRLIQVLAKSVWLICSEYWILCCCCKVVSMLSSISGWASWFGLLCASGVLVFLCGCQIMIWSKLCASVLFSALDRGWFWLDKSVMWFLMIMAWLLDCATALSRACLLKFKLRDSACLVLSSNQELML